MAYIWHWKVYWRFKDSNDKSWRIGFPACEDGQLIRMAFYNGAPQGGPIVNINDIEYQPAK